MSDPVAGFAQAARMLSDPDGADHWVFLVDDLHLLDAASTLLIRQLIDSGIVRLIGAIRADEPANDAATALLAGGTAFRIDLQSFTSLQVEDVLTAVLGGPVARQTVHELATASGGNALYLRELVAGALKSGSLIWQGEIWQLSEEWTAGTPRLMDLIDARLARAEPAARRALELLAVCEPVTLTDAEAAAGGLEALTALEEAGFVQVITDRRRTTVMLAHPLYGQALRARLRPTRRRQLLLAQVARTRAHGARRHDDPLHIAGWQLSATGTADTNLLIQAATIARHAHDYHQALILLDAVPEQDRTTATRFLHGEILVQMRSQQRAERILADADRGATREPDVLAVTLARALNIFEGRGLPEAMSMVDAAHERVTSDAGRQMLRHSRAALQIANGQPERALALLHDLSDDITTSPSPAVWLAAATFKTFALEMIGRSGEALTWAQHAYESHLKVDDHTLYAHPAIQLPGLARALAGHGRIAEARALAERGYGQGTPARIVIPRTWIALNMGRAETIAGHPVTARRWFAETIALARTRDNPTPLAVALTGLAACAALLGNADTAARILTKAPSTEHIDAVELRAVAAAWIAAAGGDLEQARTHLRSAAAAARSAAVATVEAELLTEEARLGGAAEVAGRLAELAEQSDSPLAAARAHLAAVLAAPNPDALLASAQELKTVGLDLLAAEAAATAATAYRRAGNERRATAAAQVAHAYASHCEGARTPMLVGTGKANLLTDRERDIALLATQSSAKAVANTLHLSVRTVERHLQNAYIKLGVTTRRELAAALSSNPHSPTGH
jgi:DNA-binding CsgD family transcriptional regulator